MPPPRGLEMRAHLTWCPSSPSTAESLPSPHADAPEPDVPNHVTRRPLAAVMIRFIGDSPQASGQNAVLRRPPYLRRPSARSCSRSGCNRCAGALGDYWAPSEPQNQVKAVSWWRRAAAGGSVSAVAKPRLAWLPASARHGMTSLHGPCCPRSPARPSRGAGDAWPL